MNEGINWVLQALMRSVNDKKNAGVSQRYPQNMSHSPVLVAICQRVKENPKKPTNKNKPWEL